MVDSANFMPLALTIVTLPDPFGAKAMVPVTASESRVIEPLPPFVVADKLLPTVIVPLSVMFPVVAVALKVPPTVERPRSRATAFTTVALSVEFVEFSTVEEVFKVTTPVVPVVDMFGRLMSPLSCVPAAIVALRFPYPVVIVAPVMAEITLVNVLVPPVTVSPATKVLLVSA